MTTVISHALAAFVGALILSLSALLIALAYQRQVDRYQARQAPPPQDGPEREWLHPWEAPVSAEAEDAVRELVEDGRRRRMELEPMHWMGI